MGNIVRAVKNKTQEGPDRLLRALESWGRSAGEKTLEVTVPLGFLNTYVTAKTQMLF